MSEEIRKQQTHAGPTDRDVSLAGILTEMRNGAVARHCDQQLQEVLAAIYETGKAGKLSLTLSVEPSGFDHLGKVSEITFSHELRLKTPAPNIGKSSFFVTRDRFLTRHDPDQLEFELQKEE